MTDWEAEDEALERRVRIWAVPVALLAMRLLVATSVGHFLVRTFLSMWVHETGHAVSAWLCGFLAFPGPWFTPIAAERSRVFTLLLAVAMGVGARWLWERDEKPLAMGLVGLICVQVACSLFVAEPAARAFFIFMGDGGAMILGTLLVATVWWKPAKQGWLRYGFLVIGAAGLIDPLATWWAARTDPDAIPFGMNEGQGLSDPSHLSEDFGWPASLIVSRYVTLGVVCLCALALLWVLRMSARGDKGSA
jgi:hypothetical protein